MAWTFFPRTTLPDKLLFPEATNPAPTHGAMPGADAARRLWLAIFNTRTDVIENRGSTARQCHGIAPHPQKAAVLKPPPVAVPIPQLAARRSKKLPPINIATFTTASSLKSDLLRHSPNEGFREQFTSRPMAPRHRAVQSAQAKHEWVALVTEQAVSGGASCPTIPGPIVPHRTSAARQSKSLLRSASATDTVRPPPPALDRRLWTRVPSLPVPHKMRGSPAAVPLQRSSTERLRKRPF
ncbi:hypothetical protein T484DRAFT_1744982 [Baffinella frigidus]|nr:hypothetical protein T484DRAFT_1744982 [Cryptophyta sp. CCMP2293]